MNNLKSQIATLFRILFGAVFILSATTKFLDINSFGNALSDFNLLVEYLIPIFTYDVPILEIGLGILIVLNIKPIITVQSSPNVTKLGF